ncbi:CHAT domain-containing protein [Rivibacter subsaxonicus]|uniref:Lecithin:cholesterol acyltransferase n=1 Tax=Rivibacter subsaxonicus TaxID=457575 RepID=A0A4Q7VXD8_9BURK|nr:CHAT domain-containing protein [Rivibacter subsaxonicus]RZU01009.1 lecithin:cholesterol acyltransferase [Rivibacter subsaxonicus]
MNAPRPQKPEPTPFELWARDRQRDTVVVKRASRGDGGAATSFSPEDLQGARKVLAVQFADGSVFYTDPVDYARRHGQLQATRSGDGNTAARVVLPFEIAHEGQVSRGGEGERTPIDRYTISELTEPTTLDKIYDTAISLGGFVKRWIGGIGGGKKPGKLEATLAAKLCAAYEHATLDDGVGDNGGCLLCWSELGWRPLAEGTPALSPTAPQRALLFLHGTASSTEGSFGKLWAAAPAGNETEERDDELEAQELDADPAARQRIERRRPADWKQLAATHGAILAWEHRSLTRSPLDNVIELSAALADALPAGVALDVVSHSRGGLVGELLSLRGALGGGAGAEIGQLLVDAYAEHPDLDRVDELVAALKKMQLTPGRFVRVACPARGTLLADRRTDLYLSLMLRSIQLALGGLGTFWFDNFAGLVKALVAERADAATLPGLEAMIPGSPLTRALDRCRALAQASGSAGDPRHGRATDVLRVIAGDTEDKGWGGVLSMLGDVFFGLHDHDFVVHTRSMFGGLLRADPALSLRVAGASVTHFGYFETRSLTRTALMTALAGRDDGFVPIDKDEARTRGFLQLFKSDPLSRSLACTAAADFDATSPPAHFVAPGAERKPVLLVLPGIMGSELGDPGKSPVWLSMGGMLGGDLTALDLASSRQLQATGLMALSYENLLAAAQDQFNVLAFAFDWRLPIPDSGERLLGLLHNIDQWARAHQLPVHLLVHSMGGLVARQALFNTDAGKKLWPQLKARGSRLVMLGTPNKGSYSPAQLLLRQHGLASTLAKAARKVGDDDLARYGARYEGLIAMLPQAQDPAFGDLFVATSWQKVQATDGTTTPPAVDALENVAKFMRAFAPTYEALCDDPSVLYVAGCGNTVVRMQPAASPWISQSSESSGTPGPGVEFVTEFAGDGTVPWSSTLRPERTWYAPCEHGTLADHKPSFAAYFELLRVGRTQRLPQQRPAKRGADTAGRVWRAPRPALLPESDAALQALFFGRDLGRRDSERPALDPIQVRVVHAGLDYARFPLLVGHYQEESLSGAAKRVDEKLDGQLQLAIDLGLFAGASRTGHYLRPPVRDAHEPDYPGAVVLGLGQVGELTPGALADTVTRGVLRFAFEHVNRDPFVAERGPVDLRLSAVLVGTHVQAVTVRDSLGGLLYGAWRAAQLLQGRFRARAEGVRIREIEIIEMEETTALDAAYELRRLLKRPEWQERLRWSPELLEERDGSLRGYRPARRDSIWQRLVIKQEALGGLSFELIGERARVEATRVQSDVDSLTRFVDRICDGKAQAGDRISDPADPRLGGVLFQMLLPIELKERLANLDNTVLVVNDRTARYPWELLSPPLRGREDGDRPRPFAVHAGMVRQRTAADFRRIPQAPADFDALIVGAPSTAGWVDAMAKPLRFSELPGAQLEAEAVRDMLAEDQRAWRQTVLLGAATTFEQVRFALLEKPYRLIHLCGHGVVDQWVGRSGEGSDARALSKTGMVLSDQQVLTAADVEQLNPVPEVVFINCCYSGRDGDSEAVVAGRSYPKLASSLALAFIKMGARAVVAAGWQVEDGAALLFAQNFYRQLLEGTPFGDAVRAARETVHTLTGMQSNTWGAYQCYGDPAWTMNVQTERVAEVPGRTSRLRDAHLCMTSSEFADRILQVTSVAGDKPAAVLLAQLDELLAQIGADEQRKSWLDRSRVRAALGQAYRELGDHKQAARWFQLGARRAYSQVQIGQLELLVNAMARAGGEDAPAARTAAEGIIRKLDSIAGDRDLQWPLSDEDQGRSTSGSERRCLEGGLVLRGDAAALRGKKAAAKLRGESEAAKLLGEKAAAELQWAARLFALGYRQKVLRHEDAQRRSFALSNALLAAALATLADDDPAIAIDALAFGVEDDAQAIADAAATPNFALPGDVQAWLREAGALLDELGSGDSAATFWHHTNRMEMVAATTLLARTLDRSISLQPFDEVVPLLRRALVRWPSPVELDSLEHRFTLMRDFAPSADVDGAEADLELGARLRAIAQAALEALAPRTRAAR